MNLPENNISVPQAPTTREIRDDEWIISDEMLNSRINIFSESSSEVIKDDLFKWCQMIVNGGVTDIEKQQEVEAQKEQIQLGILKLAPPPPQPQIIPQVNYNDAGKIPGTFVPLNMVNIQQQPQQQLQQSQVRTSPINKKKLGPNDKCYCNSGKKYKKCHQHLDFLSK